MSRLAIIGTGIAGLGCAHFLHRQFDLTLFEAEPRLGGHAHTIDVPEPGAAHPVALDTGFMVFNRVTYPHLSRLFDLLEIPTQPAPMSFSVRHAGTGLEFCGSSLNHLFAQRRNLLRPRFYRMLAAINRFNAEAVRALADPASLDGLTVADYARAGNYGADFLHLYLAPMSSAVWSAPPEQMASFPAVTLLRFFHNHGFLGLHTQHPWRTVAGGSRVYVQRISAPWRDRIRLGDPVTQVARHALGVTLRTARGEHHLFDHVIFACHADQALRLLAAPTTDEARLLRAFRYQPNVATVHTDTRVMPRHRLAWSSWNYEIAADIPASTATHYWMNSLQGVSDRENYFVSLNRAEAIDPRRILRTLAYDHPLFDLAALRAQPHLPRLNALAAGTTRTFFAGSYFRYGFHEDALLSAVQLSTQLLGCDPWAQFAVAEPEAAAAPLVAVA